ncbi:MAG TPA: TIGR03032 family protein [Thermoanaerobaculia bacterium]|nr:TIGR03032 family protein [Thermoanaerobaculia bacterium]
MRLAAEFIQLPLRFDAERLAAEIAGIEEAAWRPHPQGHPGNSALPLIAAGGDPRNDAAQGPMRPTPHLGRLPYLRQVLAAFGSVLGRTRLMRLDGNTEATAHTDVNYYWMQRVRIHVPVVTAPGVRFLCGDREVHMAAGEAWIFDTWKRHNVLNPNPTRRIHLVADTTGSAVFWDLVERSGDEPRFVPFDPDADPEIATETVNLPVVMSPWEQETLLTPILAELTIPSPELRAEVEAFLRDWRSLWAHWGESPEGWPAYKSRLDTFATRLRPFAGLRLVNGQEAAEAIRHAVVLVGVAPHPPGPPLPPPPTLPGEGGTGNPGFSPPLPAAGRGWERGPGGEGPFDRPLFIVASPRSGTSLLFETLAQAPGVWTIGGESHGLIEGIPDLQPAARGWDSNRLSAAEATPDVVRRLEERFLAEVRDRDGNRPPPGSHSLRLLEKTPKNSLRVPFLAQAFPDAFFLYLYRDPRETISSMLDAWTSGRFVTYPGLPGWKDLPWSLLLVPGWRDLEGQSLAEIVTRQWITATEILLDDLEALPPGRWCVAGYDQLIADPQAEIARLCDFAGLAWDRELSAPLPLSRHTLTSPAPEKWRHNAPELEPVIARVTPVAERARAIFARPPARRPDRRSPAQGPRPVVPAVSAPVSTGNPEAFRSVYTASVPSLLREIGASLLVSTYQSGRLIAVRADGDRLNTHFRSFASPMGIAVGPHYLAIGTQRHVWEYRNQPEAARRLDPPGRHDAVFLPRTSHVTGDIRVHEMAFAGGELWVVNTRFSCLAVLDGEHSFVPRWRPSFVSALVPEDRCHLNGLAVVDGRVRWATALGATDAPQGWREDKAHGGVLLDVSSGETVARGLSMPHSPRWYGGRLWVLESGKGTLAVVDPLTHRVDTVTELPGFTRGLAFAGPFAFVGLSQVRETNIFGGLPLTERVKEKLCGVWVVDLRSGKIAGFLRFEGLVQEIFDVQILRARWPEIAEPDSDLIAGSFALPDEALAEVGRAG